MKQKTFQRRVRIFMLAAIRLKNEGKEITNYSLSSVTGWTVPTVIKYARHCMDDGLVGSTERYHRPTVNKSVYYPTRKGLAVFAGQLYLWSNYGE